MSEVVEIMSTLNPRAGRVGGLGVIVAVISIAWTWKMSHTSPEPVYVPTLDGKWWTVARNPNLGALTGEKQQPVDFAVWQAADGTWQLWSCIRHTKCGGKTRLFYGWEGKHLTDSDWTPAGIKMQAEPQFGETEGGLQAPHVIKAPFVVSHEASAEWRPNGTPLRSVPDYERSGYRMFYGDWEHICMATSVDGKNFTRQVLPSGRTGMFGEGAGANTRDPMVLKIGDLWHCYYTAYPNQQGAVFCRTSADLQKWSEPRTVAFGGQAGTGPFSAECPHVVQYRGRYYLFRTQRYGKDAQTSVYHSTDPLKFGIDEDDRYLLTTLPIAAPEIVLHDGQYYIAALRPELDGIQITQLKWVKAKC